MWRLLIVLIPGVSHHNNPAPARRVLRHNLAVGQTETGERDHGTDGIVLQTQTTTTGLLLASLMRILVEIVAMTERLLPPYGYMLASRLRKLWHWH